MTTEGKSAQESKPVPSATGTSATEIDLYGDLTIIDDEDGGNNGDTPTSLNHQGEDMSDDVSDYPEDEEVCRKEEDEDDDEDEEDEEEEADNGCKTDEGKAQASTTTTTTTSLGVGVIGCVVDRPKSKLKRQRDPAHLNLPGPQRIKHIRDRVWKSSNLSSQSNVITVDDSLQVQTVPDNPPAQPITSLSEVDHRQETLQEVVGFEPSLAAVMKKREEKALLDPPNSTDRKVIMRRLVHIKYNRFLPFMDTNNPLLAQALGQKGVDGMKLYTQETQLACHWCTEPVNGVPFPVARKLVEAKRPWERIWSKLKSEGQYAPPKWWFEVSGVYCNPSCALSAAKDQSHALLTCTRRMFSKVYGIGTRVPGTNKIREIKFAPRKELLQKFGGSLSIEAFRASCTPSSDTTLTLVNPPLVPLSMGMQEVEDIHTTFAQVLDQSTIDKILKEGLSYEGHSRTFNQGKTPARRRGQGRGRRGNNNNRGGGKAPNRRNRNNNNNRNKNNRQSSAVPVATGETSGVRVTGGSGVLGEGSQQQQSTGADGNNPGDSNIRSILEESNKRLRLQQRQIDGLAAANSKKSNQSNLMRFMKKRDDQ